MGRDKNRAEARDQDSGRTMYIYTVNHQADEWEQAAEEQGMSLSAWGRYQIEAGRKQMAALDPLEQENESRESGLRNEVIEAIPEDEGVTTNQVVQTVLDPIEDRVKEHLRELDNEGEIGYDPVKEGYVCQ